ncbi:MAG: aminoglycoside phosphotransferase [Frankiales bacterium]|nr:aminoglycoside phosphotransferase [Frankiales bacterium]
MPDDSRELRPEDAFDVGGLHRWLSTRVGGLGGPPVVRQFAGGASNLTYLLRYPDRELVLRRPPVGQKAASAHDMRREHRVQQALAPQYPYVPAMVAFCDDPSVMGSDFYVMEKVDGTILRGRLPAGLSLSPDQARALALRAVDSLVALHGVDVEAAGLTDLGRGPGYVGRQVAGWSDRFRAARTEDVPDFTAVMTWLADHQPDDVAMCLVHNDFRLDNLVLDADLRVVAVLDWEMATIGDPLMDLGGALAYWVQADDDDVMRLSKRQPTDVAGMPTRDEVVAHYRAATGLPVDGWAFYEVFGLFRLAVIVQQIYLRYSRGQTTNPAFKDFHHFVTYLESRCRTVAGRA